MRVEPFTRKGYELLHEGILELSRVEHNGIGIDVDRIGKTRKRMEKKLRGIKNDLQKQEPYRIWRKRYGDKTSFTSRKQLATVLFTEMKLPRVKLTEGGDDAADDEVLQQINHPFTDLLAEFYRFDKALGTFINGIEKEIVDGRLHPVFNLHLVRSYRSSSDSPNFQNFPVRNKDIAMLIRSLFIPSPHSVFSENDFKGIEVGVSACYHEDENFIDYISTPGKDMHRDMAAQIYLLDPPNVSKDARYGAKNKFVFPEFYGDYYLACAKNLWDWALKAKLTTPDGKRLVSFDKNGRLTGWLKEQGITGLGKCDPDQKPVKGTFEHHLQQIEKDFWERRFRGYGDWRKQTYRDYLQNGYFDLFTGFRIYGVCNRKVVTNYPIQGSAFHCLLWTLIQVNKALRKYRMKSMIVGQIHDSLLGDVRTKEVRDYLEIVEETVTVKLPKHYEWLKKIQLEIEYEMSPSLEAGGNWHKKRVINFKKGRFQHPALDEKGDPKFPKKWTTSPEAFVNILNSLSKN